VRVDRYGDRLGAGSIGASFGGGGGRRRAAARPRAIKANVAGSGTSLKLTPGSLKEISSWLSPRRSARALSVLEPMRVTVKLVRSDWPEAV